MVSKNNEIVNLIATAKARTARQEGVGGRNAEPSERIQTEASPAACSVRAEPSKTFVSF